MKKIKTENLLAKTLKDSVDGVFDENNILNLLKHKNEIALELIQTAKQFNLNKFNKKIELYCVSYISDFCINSCTYCGHSYIMKHVRNKLSKKEMEKDFSAILKYNPNEICILAGESKKVDTKYLIDAANIIIQNNTNKNLERITFNVAPMNTEDLKTIRNGIKFNIQFRIFQESYDIETYTKHHLAGPKKDFLFRVKAQERALDAGFDEVGIGVLLGLNNKENGNDYEILELIKHAFFLKNTFNKYPYSISIPRLQKVSHYQLEIPKIIDEDYILYHAILRLALPETKIIITSRESPELKDLLRPLINIEDLGVKPGVGGNYKQNKNIFFQNVLNDARNPQETLLDLQKKGYRVSV